jgi:hypothetical protein
LLLLQQLHLLLLRLEQRIASLREGVLHLLLQQQLVLAHEVQRGFQKPLLERRIVPQRIQSLQAMGTGIGIGDQNSFARLRQRVRSIQQSVRAGEDVLVARV